MASSPPPIAHDSAWSVTTTAAPLERSLLQATAVRQGRGGKAMASAMQRLDGRANRELADMFTLLQSHGRVGQEQLTHLAEQLGGSVAAEVLRVRRERCGVGGKKSFNRASFIEHFKDTFYVTSTRERERERERCFVPVVVCTRIAVS